MAEQHARLLVIMGSGETSPTMSKVHRELFDRLGPAPIEAVILDTPTGFQENADDIAAKAVAYFRESVNRDVTVASFRSADEVGTLAHEKTLARLRDARWVFSGPGSPSYALRQWHGSEIPPILAKKLEQGGCIVFASAAAVTLGPVSVPVYEVYKVGEPPRWLPGLDLLAPLGLTAAVIPHYNNAEGGNHDTRYCYMGERRLRMLEDQLPEGVFVLGVDEHTACILDLEAGTATVAGLGRVTVRSHGHSSFVESGQTVRIACLNELAAGPAGDGGSPIDATSSPAAPAEASPLAASPLLDDVGRLETSFAEALRARDGPAAVSCVLALEALLVDWSRDTLQSDEMRRGRAALRGMIVRLGDAAEHGLRDERTVLGPLVDALLAARDRARADRRWDDADDIRDRLVAAGVEVQDTAAGTTWNLR
ncbi:MAG TPA: hypothetical protein VF045_11905 [Acidimicrobiales bacterium]